MIFLKRHFYSTIIFISMCYLTLSFNPEIEPSDLEHVQQELDYLPSSFNIDALNQDAASDMAKCMAVMRKYCNVRPLPTAGDCVRQAVLTWHKDVIPNGILKNYYLSFAERPENLKSMSEVMMTPNGYCSTFPDDMIMECEDDLKNFKETREDALKYALYETTIHEFCKVVEQDGTKIIQPTNKNAYNYMMTIRTLVFVFENPDPIPEPLDYCKTISTNPGNKDSPLDWTPYLPNEN